MLSLSMAPIPRLELRLECRCTVCDQPHDSSKAAIADIERRLFGAAKYALCSCCGQEVSQPWSQGYKVRWTRWRHKE